MSLVFLYNQKPLIGISGRIQTSSYEKDGETKYITEIIGEKVTFLSSKKQNDKIEEAGE